MNARPRPPLPWYLEDAIHDNNPFNNFATPGGILVYIDKELPSEVVDGILHGVIEAGAGRGPLMRDVIELYDMGADDLAARVFKVAVLAPERPMGIAATDFWPEKLRTADQVTILATAAITKMRIRERMEGVPVQERDSG
jgi:hypothetical protein